MSREVIKSIRAQIYVAIVTGKAVAVVVISPTREVIFPWLYNICALLAYVGVFVLHWLKIKSYQIRTTVSQRYAVVGLDRWRRSPSLERESVCVEPIHFHRVFGCVGGCCGWWCVHCGCVGVVVVVVVVAVIVVVVVVVVVVIVVVVVVGDLRICCVVVVVVVVVVVYIFVVVVVWCCCGGRTICFRLWDEVECW